MVTHATQLNKILLVITHLKGPNAKLYHTCNLQSSTSAARVYFMVIMCGHIDGERP